MEGRRTNESENLYKTGGSTENTKVNPILPPSHPDFSWSKPITTEGYLCMIHDLLSV